jgi:hypothetical protein
MKPPSARLVVAGLVAAMLVQAGVTTPAFVLADGPSPAPSVAPSPTPSEQPAPTVEPSPSPAGQGDQSDTTPGVERVDMRTANSQTFEQPDGSFITDFYSDNVFYQPAGQTEWQPIDVSLSPANDNGVLARAAHAPALVDLSAGDAANGFLTLTGGGHTISFGLPAGKAPGRADTPPVISADSARADYADFLPGGIGLRVFPSADGFTSVPRQVSWTLSGRNRLGSGGVR